MPGFSTLTALRTLNLLEITLQPALLAAVPGLQQLRLHHVLITAASNAGAAPVAAAAAAGGAALLAALRELTHLEELHLYHVGCE